MKMYALRFSIKTSITMLNLLSIFLASAFRPEDTTSEQMLNCIRNLIDIGIIAKDDASS